MKRPALLLVHGWGFSSGFWRLLRGVLPEERCQTVDLGFFGQATAPFPLSEPCVGVGHSLGFLWLLHHWGHPDLRAKMGLDWLQGLVSINGFSCFLRRDDFKNGIYPQVLQRMQRQFIKNPGEVMRAFCHQGGGPNFTLPVKSNQEFNAQNRAALLEGLEWLATWDHRETLQQWNSPLLVLATQEDLIVPQAMTEELFSTHVQIHWSPKGGSHLLPLLRPEWSGLQLGQFLNREFSPSPGP
ncbi:MAG: alpha/beta hydrolase [Magnetococcus sp. DMHC-6]